MKPLLLGFDGRGQPLNLSPDDRLIHTHVIGSSGSGKSKFLECMMRGDLRNGQGFCLLDPHGSLYDAVADFCARYPTLARNVVLLNPSAGDAVVGFNPFQRTSEDSIAVQVDNRITATMHAWGVKNTDETPTLERTLRLIYTVVLEHNLGLPQARHLINFESREIRVELIEKLQTELVASEWRELQALKPNDWRHETLSAKNKLFRFLNSPPLMRCMGVPGRTLDLKAAMDDGKVLLVNLARSKNFSKENARVLGALLVNEFFEAAVLRPEKDNRGRKPKPYYLYMDEFQNFVSLDIADMLDEVRKRGLFTVLAHQRFGQLDENVIDAILTNCRIKAVFGGLKAESAKLMAQELFIGKLDPYRVMAAIYQTKFWPKYTRDKVYTRGTSHSSTTSHTSTTGGADGHAATTSEGSSQALFYDDWFSLPQLSGTRTETVTRNSASQKSASSSWAASSTDGVSDTESESVADIPIFVPVPFQELSSVQFMPIETQLHLMTAALKEQFPRHCFIKIQQHDTEPLLVPNVEDVSVSRTNRQWWINKSLSLASALAPEAVDGLLNEQETALLQSAGPEVHSPPVAIPAEGIWTRQQSPLAASPKKIHAKKSGPSPDAENHLKTEGIVAKFGDKWGAGESLVEVCEELDAAGVPVPQAWWSRLKNRAQTWTTAYRNNRREARRAIQDRLKAARKIRTKNPGGDELSPTSYTG
jgi:TraM recognition site of TraD and TraG/Type IV secretion-system coupling protein DNA-binding domain